MVPPYWHYAIIVLAGLIAYWPSFRGVYLLDDDLHIVANPEIKQLWPITRHLSDPDRPVVRLSLAINYALGGIEPFGFHIFNLAIHFLAALTLYGLIRGTLALRAPSPAQASGLKSQASSLAFTVALLWVVHPLTTQAVTYIIQRAESTMALFFLLTLYCVMRGARSARAPLWYAAAIAACAAGMGCKEVMATAPLVVLLYDRIFLAESWKDVLRRRWPLYAGLFLTGAILLRGGAAAGLTGAESANAATVGFGFEGVTPWQYLRTQPEVILHYLRLVVWPHPLCFDYDWPPATLSSRTISAGLAILAAVVASAWAVWRGRPIGFLGAAFFLILAPTSSFVPIKDLAVEHRLYLPLAAVIALIVFVLHRLLGSADSRSTPLHAVLLGGAALLFGLLTYQRNTLYQSEIGLWTDVVAQRPGNARAWDHLGNAQMDADQTDKAIASFQAALRIVPNWALVENNLGNALAKAGRLEEAAAALQSALDHAPVLTHVHLNLGMVLHKLGRLGDAVEHYRLGLAASPQLVPSQNNMGIALRDLGRLAEAEEAHRTALRYAPNDADTRYALAYVLELQGKRAEAAAEYREVLRIEPGHANAKVRLAALGQPK
ncbi:MAG TPA: tetratricopeptide repeat protein [Phycisphaerae bacterium]|nr:tetratricopeptide repeat protein [Phycisphaerae bacterium]